MHVCQSSSWLWIFPLQVAVTCLRGQYFLVSETCCLEVKFHSEPNTHHILSLQDLFFLHCAFASPVPKQGHLSCSLVPITAKGSGYSYPLPPPWVGKHPSCVWSLEGAYAWHQLITPETGLCLARVGRAKVSSCEAHQTLFILLWTGSHFHLVGREPWFNSQKDTR